MSCAYLTSSLLFLIRAAIHLLYAYDDLPPSCRRSTQSLENDMATIRVEHENENRMPQAQKDVLDTVI